MIMKRMLLFFAILPVAILAACQGTAPAEEEQARQVELLPETDTLASVVNELRVESAQLGLTNPTADLGTRHTYAMGMVKFSMAEVSGLVATPFDSVPWYEMQEAQTAPENDQVAYFFLEGERYSLSATHVRVEWLAKGYPQRNKESELHEFIRGVYMNNVQNGRLVGESTIETRDGQKVQLLELYVPTRKADSITYGSKILAYAWIDQGNSFVGFSLSSQEPEKYKHALVRFRKMLASFKKE